MSSPRTEFEILSLENENLARAFKLTTQIKPNPEKPNEVAIQYYALCATVEFPNEYHAQLVPAVLLDAHVGEMYTAKDFAQKLSTRERMSIELRENFSTPEKGNEIYIQAMHAGGGNRGRAYHETAFRMSLALGAEGRVSAGASWSSHCFHYQCGLRSGMPKLDNQIATLLQQSKETGKKADSNFLAGVTMYLPVEMREQKLQEFNATSPKLQTSIYIYCPEKPADFKESQYKPFRIRFDEREDAMDFVRTVGKGMVVKLNIENKPEYREDRTLLTIERLEEVIKSSAVLQGFYAQVNWQRIKRMANQAILFANEYKQRYPQKTSGLFGNHGDQAPMEAIRTAAKEFLQTSITSGSIREAYAAFFLTLLEEGKKMKDWSNKFDTVFKQDIYDTFNQVLGTSMEIGTWLKGKKPLLPLEVYAQTLKETLCNESAVPTQSLK